MLLPPVAAGRLRDGEELGDIIDDLFERKESKRQAGAIGILTEGAMSRTDAFAYLVAMACAPPLHPDLYAEGSGQVSAEAQASAPASRPARVPPPVLDRP